MRARREGFEKLCAFTHAPGYFIQMGFSIVPHLWLPEKIFTDCVKCPLFRQCGQYAMVVPLDRASDASDRDGAAVAATHDAPLALETASSRSPAASPRRRASAPPASAPASRRKPARSTSRCSSSDAPGHGGRGVHDQPGAGGAGRSSRASTWRDPAASRARSSSTAAAPTPAPATTGMRDARDMAAETARLVGCPVEQVLVASTGVIGVALPMDKIRRGAARRRSRRSAPIRAAAAARAIMTTDPFPEGSGGARRRSAAATSRIGGMAKGSGMIEPMMATMLGFVTTDAAVPQPLLDRALREAVDDTFNAITVDGECSTNDCVMLLANGASGVDDRRAQLRRVRRRRCARSACELALGIVRGGEGATKLVTVTVTGAASAAEARQAAKAIANSLLVKTAIHGGDPNWGRLIAVAGRAGVAFELSRAAVTIGADRAVRGRPAARRGGAGGGRVPQGNGHRRVGVDLGAGAAASTVWTCDLSAEYVRINAEYRT